MSENMYDGNAIKQDGQKGDKPSMRNLQLFVGTAEKWVTMRVTAG